MLDVHGVGYRVGICETLPSEGDEATLYLSEVIREDKYDLYGFLAEDSLHLFEALIGVQGVGPKVGMKIMSAGAPDHIRKTILAGDVAFFGQVPGIGKKTAQKIILELKCCFMQSSAHVIVNKISHFDGYVFGFISAAI